MFSIKQQLNKISLSVSLLAGMVFLFFGAHTLAAITRGYSTDDPGLKPGMVVSLSQNNSSDNPKVERSSADHIENVIGVATTVNDSLVTVSSGGKTIYVESEGEVDAFVANLNGEIKKGDLLTLSPLRGILTRATLPQPFVAIALDDFIAEEADSYTVQDVGQEREVKVGRISVNLDRKAFSSLAEEESVLARLGKAIIGKDVGEIQVVVALIIFFIVLVAEGTILYGAISSAIKSLGRNPLAKNIISRELIRVFIIALAVMLLGVAAIYAVLWV